MDVIDYQKLKLFVKTFRNLSLNFKKPVIDYNSCVIDYQTQKFQISSLKSHNSSELIV